MNITADDIAAHDRVFGNLCRETEITFANGNYFSALACLFILAEQTIKYRIQENDGNFHSLLEKSQAEQKITPEYFILLIKIKDFRNKLFHKNHYSLYIDVNSIAYPIDEDEAKIIIYEAIQPFLYKFILNTLENARLVE